MTKEQLLAEAMALDPAEREGLAEVLLLTIDGGDRASIDAAWAEEIDGRLTAFDRGDVRTVPPDEMFRRLTERYARCPLGPRGIIR